MSNSIGRQTAVVDKQREDGEREKVKKKEEKEKKSELICRWLPAGQDANHIVGLVAFDAHGTVVKVDLRLLVALPDGTNLQFADGLLGCVAQASLSARKRDY